MERDQMWAATCEVAERLTARYCEGTTLKVRASRRHKLWSVTEGLRAWGNGTDVFEPVRTRHPFSRGWTEIQPVQDAASKIGYLAREQLNRTTG
jgi:hypothetical protein